VVVVPMAGRKPKSGPVRHRVKPVHDWTEVTWVPFEDGPELPSRPRNEDLPPSPAPPRPLGREGRKLWERTWRAAGGQPVDEEALLMLCEQTDERVDLRPKVIEDGSRWARAALRAIDAQIAQGLSALGLQSSRTIPERWPAETRRWWRAVSRMPHCTLWTESDWQYALDTACVAAAFHSGDARLAGELRQREKVLGLTQDSRRDLRIRYVPPAEETEEPAGVAVMDEYRRMAAEA
jgi:hypothetical protein